MENKMERLQQQMAFIMEIDKEKEIFRQNYLADGSRRENDSEHAWHMAIMAILLAEHAEEPIDVLHTVYMLLVHDLVEIDAGDTYAYDASAHRDKRAREEAAADRIFNLLPPDQAKKLRDIWEEFEAGETPEARFANSLDKIQPLILNAASGGKSWQEHQVAVPQIYKRNEHTAEGSEALWKYGERIIRENQKSGTLYSEIYLAGGCFWGTQHYFDCMPGVIKTEVGYANGPVENPSYEDVKLRHVGHAETVRVVYDRNQLPLELLLE